MKRQAFDWYPTSEFGIINFDSVYQFFVSFRNTVVEWVFMISLLAARLASSVDLQKKMALSSLNGMRWWTKLKLQLLAMAIAMASLFFRDSIQSQTIAFCQFGCCCWTPDMMFKVAVRPDHGLCLWFLGDFVAGGWAVGLWQCGMVGWWDKVVQRKMN